MDLLAAATRRQRTHGDLCNLLAGQPSTGAPVPVRDEAVRLLDSGDPLGYTPSAGILELREAIAGHHQRIHGVNVDPDEVVVTTGSSGGFLLAFLAAFEPGDRVAMARPGYPCYRNVLTALGCEVVEIPTGRRRGSSRRSSRSPRIPDLKGLVVASPANPTGTMLLPAELAALAAWCEENGVQLISDEIYHGIEYAPLDGHAPLVAQRLGDQPRGRGLLELLQVLLDDRLADRLDAGARAAAPRGRRAHRQLHDLPAGDRPAGLPGRVQRRVVRRARRPRRAVRREPSPAPRAGCRGSASPSWRRRTARSTCTPTSATSPTTRWRSPTTCSPAPALRSRRASTSTPPRATGSSGSASPGPGSDIELALERLATALPARLPLSEVGYRMSCTNSPSWVRLRHSTIGTTSPYSRAAESPVSQCRRCSGLSHQACRAAPARSRRTGSARSL